jgi:glycosyltransferase involved in cell wall biosynthesis
MKTLTLVSAGLELPDRNTLLRLEAADEFPRVSLFYEVLNSDRLDERFLEQAPRLRRLAYHALPNIAGCLSEALLIKNRYDAVISWTERFGLTFSFLLGPLRSQTPHIAIFSWISGQKKAEILQRVYHNIDKIVLMSSVQREIAINRLGIPSSRLQLLKWGVDQKFWRPMNVDPDMICSVGSERRDYPTLIAAMRDTSIPCHIAAGTQRNVIHPTVKAIWQNGKLPPNVTVERKSYVDLRSLYARSKFVVIPILESDTDHGATSILEAMATGKAVICSKTSGQVDIIRDRKTGLLVPHGDPASLRQAIQYLWDNPDVAEQMGREGRKYVENHHTIDAFVNSIKTVVCDVIQQKNHLTGMKGFRSTKAVRENENAVVSAGKAATSFDKPSIRRRLKILMAFHLPSYPANYGAAKRNFHLFEEAAKRHELSILSYGTAEDERMFREAFGKLCKHVVFVAPKPRWLRRVSVIWLFVTGKSSFYMLKSRRFQEALDALVRKESFDIFHLPLVLAVHRLPMGIRLIGDMQNVEFDNFYRAYKESSGLFRKLYYGIEYRLTRFTEVALAKKLDALLAPSERDLGMFLREFPNATMHVIPNGVDLAFFSAQKEAPIPRTMVFVGLMNYYPNHHGLLWFLDEVFPRILERVPDARITVVGANPSKAILKRATENIVIAGYVDDVRGYIARAEVFIVPLLIGGGTRLKALEAMAMKKPIVSTTVGCEGIQLKHEESALFGDTPEEFAGAVVRMFHDPGLRSRLVEKAYANVRAHYGWESIGEELERAHQSLASLRIKG